MSKQTFIVRKMALAGLFTSMGVVLKFLSITTEGFRLSFFDLIIIFSGIVLGPAYGLSIGFMVDIIEYFLAGRGFPFSFTILFSTMLTGFIPGLIFYRYQVAEKISYLRVILSVIFATLIAYGLNTFYFFTLFGAGAFKDLWPRTIVMIAKWPLYSLAIPVLYRTYLKYSPLNHPFKPHPVDQKR